MESPKPSPYPPQSAPLPLRLHPPALPPSRGGDLYPTRPHAADCRKDCRQLAGGGDAPPRRSVPAHSLPSSLPFASVSSQQDGQHGKHAFDVALSSGYAAKTLAGTAVYSVSNSNNEFVLISDPNGVKSVGLLCFRQEDAEAFLAQVLSVCASVKIVNLGLIWLDCDGQVRSRKGELRGQAKVVLVSITLDQVIILAVKTYYIAENVYMLKVEGIAFRFLPDPVQIKNALEVRTIVI
ncbi:hypothetical protein RJ639_037719 [Escallonia herrerae]|uniref:Uncharacterized protein n=1 Tax=Escallonia herrerae TaxID=1293975 RepID=A0AA88WN36_9ASTE|nr:hypothetical protein RJ639_037719 [Escallonia herrerae]